MVSVRQKGEMNFKEKKMKKLMFVIAAVAMMATSAYAADWNFYGSARVEHWWTETDTINTGTTVDQLTTGLVGNGRIGAKVKVSDELAGRFEYSDSVGLRLLYGTWNFGAGSLTVGQDYGPVYIGYSSQVALGDANMLATGAAYSSRVAQIKLTFGGFEIAAVSPSTGTDGAAVTSTEVSMPAIEAAYTMDINNVSIKLAGGYQTYEATSGGRVYDIGSYVVAAGAKATMGPFWVAGNLMAGENIGNLISCDTDNTNVYNKGTTTNNGYATINATSVSDNEAFGYQLVVGYMLNEMFSFEAGYGAITTELDNTNVDDDASTYYVQAKVTLAPGVYVIPEVGVFDGEETNDFETTYYGVRWQINF